MNTLKTAFLMTVMMILFLLVGYLHGGNPGMTMLLQDIAAGRR